MDETPEGRYEAFIGRLPMCGGVGTPCFGWLADLLSPIVQFVGSPSKRAKVETSENRAICASS